jgi:hypothetical protein
MDPMVFSPNSRYLALTEYTGTDHQLSRVVVLDFLTDTLIICPRRESRRDRKTVERHFVALDQRFYSAGWHIRQCQRG